MGNRIIKEHFFISLLNIANSDPFAWKSVIEKSKELTANLYLKQSSTKYSYMGQNPPQNIFNPLAWADFIQAWKRGDFKNNN